MKIENLDTARFDCVYPTCGGICCMNGRPAVEQREEDLLRANIDKFADRLLPDARARIARHGFLDARVQTDGRPTLAVSKGWCVFFNEGCVLQKVGAEEGDALRYKPWRCALFPLKRDPKSGNWFVRQQGHKSERWDLFCLHPGESPKSAATTLTAEVAHLEKLAAERRLPPFQPPDATR